MNRFAKIILVPYGVIGWFTGLSSGASRAMHVLDNNSKGIIKSDYNFSDEVGVTSTALIQGVAFGIVAGVFWPIFAYRFTPKERVGNSTGATWGCLVVD